MKWLTIIALTLVIRAQAQVDVTFSSTVPHSIPDNGMTVDTIDVQTSWLNIDCQSFGIKSVQLKFSHSLPYQTFAYIIHGNDTVHLFHQGSLQTLPDSIDCTFSMLYTSIVFDGPPYMGSYAPTGNLGRFNSGVNPNGNWILVVGDQLGGGFSGILHGWGITFGNDSLFCPIAEQFSDASTPLVVCNDVFNTTGSSGSGAQNDSLLWNLECLGSERGSSWLKFNIVQSGELSFLIHSATDNDFILWQTDAIGNPIGSSLRCSMAIDGGLTGLSPMATVNADTLPILPVLNVLTGDHYMMLVNNNGYYHFGQNIGANMPFYLELTGNAMTSCDMATLISKPSSEVKFSIVENGILINVDYPHMVSVFDVSGRAVYGPAMLSNTTFIPLPSSQLYLLLIDREVKKVFRP